MNKSNIDSQIKILDFLRSQNIDEKLVTKVEEYKKAFPTPESLSTRVPTPKYFYYGKEIWEKVINAILGGENILLTGMKSTGKNILASNICTLFGRPEWTVSFHSGTDYESLIGADTFKSGEVVYKKASIYKCAETGGFAVLDEINMAKNEALATLFSILDYRRMIDISGYDKLQMHDATRFIGTMNYGYAGTKELNEALVSRFMVINMPLMESDLLESLILSDFPKIKLDSLEAIKKLFSDIQQKVTVGEISSKSLDIRGFLASLKLINNGLSPLSSFEMGIQDKVFDAYERDIVRDLLMINIRKYSSSSDFFD